MAEMWWSSLAVSIILFTTQMPKGSIINYGTRLRSRSMISFRYFRVSSEKFEKVCISEVRT